MSLDRPTYRLMAAVVAVGLLAAVGAAWLAGSGEDGVSTEGAAALGLGVFFTIMLCGALMAAMFFSDRSGRDQ